MPGQYNEFEEQRCREIEVAVKKEEQRKVEKLKEDIEKIKENLHLLNEVEWKDGMEPTHQRVGWDEYFLSMLPLIGARATCNRGRSGCLIVKDNRILMSGYVGAPPGMPHCDNVGHEFEWRLDYDPNDCEDYDALIDDMHRHCIRTIHAEANAIYHCARKGVSCEGATIYCTMTPCRRCAEAIVQAGIIRVITEKEYHIAEPAIEYFQIAGVELITVGGKIEYTA